MSFRDELRELATNSKKCKFLRELEDTLRIKAKKGEFKFIFDLRTYNVTYEEIDKWAKKRNITCKNHHTIATLSWDNV